MRLLNFQNYSPTITLSFTSKWPRKGLVMMHVFCAANRTKPQNNPFIHVLPDKVKKKYANLGHTILMVQLERGNQGLGLSLAGHKDRSCMAVFVCGLNPNGAAFKTGTIQVGDEILEVSFSNSSSNRAPSRLLVGCVVPAATFSIGSSIRYYGNCKSNGLDLARLFENPCLAITCRI